MLSDRQQKLLNFIIKEFVKTAKPVASELIANKGDFDVSPATIRSEMYELEKSGYLEQLHTSGGRVPRIRRTDILLIASSRKRSQIRRLLMRGRFQTKREKLRQSLILLKTPA